MRSQTLLPTLALLLGAAACSGGDSAPPSGAPGLASNVHLRLDGLELDAACGTCQFGMVADGCALAVRLPGGEATFWLDGTGIDDHGDAHADDGFCNAVRRAVVSAESHRGRLQVSAFELLPVGEQD